MKLTEIEKLPAKANMPVAARRLRSRAPVYLRSIIEESQILPGVSSVKELRSEHLQTMGGGAEAATYLLNTPGKQLIIKFSYGGIAAEAEALKVWKARHVRVPHMIAHGQVPADQRVKYLVQQALVDYHGRVGETCADYLLHKPEQSRSVGRLLGRELTKLHQAVAKRSFGDYADNLGNTAPYGSWNKYIMGYIDLHAEFLEQLGVSQIQFEKLRDIIQKRRFLKCGRYLHGDFSVRNAVVTSHEPLKVGVFDPNPIIGDPTWDIAVMFNNRDYRRRRMKYDDHEHDLFRRDQQLVIGLQQGYGRQIDEGSLEISQLAQALLQTAHQADTTSDKVKLRVRHETVLDLVGKILKRGRKNGA